MDVLIGRSGQPLFPSSPAILDFASLKPTFDQVTLIINLVETLRLINLQHGCLDCPGMQRD